MKKRTRFSRQLLGICTILIFLATQVFGILSSFACADNNNGHKNHKHGEHKKYVSKCDYGKKWHHKYYTRNDEKDCDKECDEECDKECDEECDKECDSRKGHDCNEEESCYVNTLCEEEDNSCDGESYSENNCESEEESCEAVSSETCEEQDYIYYCETQTEDEEDCD